MPSSPARAEPAGRARSSRGNATLPTARASPSPVAAAPGTATPPERGSANPLPENRPRATRHRDPGDVRRPRKPLFFGFSVLIITHFNDSIYLYQLVCSPCSPGMAGSAEGRRTSPHLIKPTLSAMPFIVRNHSTGMIYKYPASQASAQLEAEILYLLN